MIVTRTDTSREPTAARIRALLQPLQPTELRLQDHSAAHARHPGAAAGGGHFRLRIVSECFQGLPALQRHRLVHERLAELLRSELHALSVETLTPAEARRAPGSGNQESS